jgi:hypothetical protein
VSKAKPATKRAPTSKKKPPPAAKKKAGTKRTAKKPRKGPVEAAVDRDLKAIGSRQGSHALAATARALARELDFFGNSAHSKALCAKALQDCLERLRELSPPKEKKDRVDELSSRRKKRVARSSRRSAA